MLALSLGGCSATPEMLGEAQYHERFWSKHKLEGERALIDGRYRDARKYFEYALAEAETFGSTDPRLGVTLEELAVSMIKLDQISSAIPVLERSLKILRGFKARNQNDIDIGRSGKRQARALVLLARCYMKQNKFVEAKPLLTDALRIYSTWPMPDKPLVVRDVAGMEEYGDCLWAMAKVCRQLEKNLSADAFYQRAYKLLSVVPTAQVAFEELSNEMKGLPSSSEREALPPDASKVERLADSAWRAGDFEKAESLYKEDLDDARAAKAIDRQIRDLKNLADLSASWTKFQEAEGLYKEAAALCESTKKWKQADKFLTALIRMHVDSAEFESAAELLEKQAELRIKVFGKNSEERAQSFIQYVHCLYRMKRLKEALTLLERVNPEFQKALGANSNASHTLEGELAFTKDVLAGRKKPRYFQ